MQLCAVTQYDFVTALKLNVHLFRHLLNESPELVSLTAGCRQKYLVALVRVFHIIAQRIKQRLACKVPGCANLAGLQYHAA